MQSALVVILWLSFKQETIFLWWNGISYLNEWTNEWNALYHVWFFFFWEVPPFYPIRQHLGISHIILCVCAFILSLIIFMPQEKFMSDKWMSLYSLIHGICDQTCKHLRKASVQHSQQKKTELTQGECAWRGFVSGASSSQISDLTVSVSKS